MPISKFAPAIRIRQSAIGMGQAYAFQSEVPELTTKTMLTSWFNWISCSFMIAENLSFSHGLCRDSSGGLWISLRGAIDPYVYKEQVGSLCNYG